MTKLLFILSWLFVQIGSATICLNMIVKDESPVIERCLSSVLPLIDTFVIVDTGSSDNTQDVIRKFMQKHQIPGEVHQRPWVNFSHNRNEALALAQTAKVAEMKADYILFMDADEYLEYEPDFKLPPLDKDYFWIKTDCYGSHFHKIQLIKSSLVWKWVGVLHEGIDPPPASTSGVIGKIANIYTMDGARQRDPLKFHKDAEVLEKALLEEPENERYVFYLAQSYRCSSQHEKALEAYKKRATMGGWIEEVYYSLMQAGKMSEILNKPTKDIVQCYTQALFTRPSRAESFYYLASYYRKINDFEMDYQIAKLGAAIPPSSDNLFVEDWIWDFGMPLELSVAAFYTGRLDEFKSLSEALLKKETLPKHIRQRVETNLTFLPKIKSQSVSN